MDELLYTFICKKMQGYRVCLKHKNPATYSINKVWFKCPAPMETLLWRRLCFWGWGFSWAIKSPCVSLHPPEAVVPSSFNPAETGCLMELHSCLRLLPHLTRTFSLSNWTLFRELMFSICVFAKAMLLAMSESKFSGNELKMKLRSSDQ